MPTIRAELDKVEQKLNDASNAIWTRAELLRWYNDGLVELVEQSAAVRRFWLSDIPPRYSYSITYDWEDRHTEKGEFWKFSVQTYDQQYQCFYRWEVEHLEGITPTNSADFITQQWERYAATNGVDAHYRVALPRNHDQIKRVTWDDERLDATSTMELDSFGNDWPQESGEIDFWLLGAGRTRSIELYEIQTAYSQEYDLQQDNGLGLPRFFSGSRTYSTDSDYMTTGYAWLTSGDTDNLVTNVVSGVGHRVTLEETTTGYFVFYQWEKEHLEGETTLTDSDDLNFYSWEAAHDSAATEYTYAVGTIEQITSANRQYLCNQQQLEIPFGIATEFKSSVDSLMVEQVAVPSFSYGEGDTPDFMPPQLQKYIRYFVLHRAFGRIGEGHRGDLSDHYRRRYERGVRVFSTLQDVAHRARRWARSPSFVRARPPFVKLPSEFPRRVRL